MSVDDVFFRIGGATAGSVTDAFIDNSDSSILDDIWSWPADHSAGGGSHDLLTVWLNNSGGVQSVINGTGAAVSSTNPGPVNLVTYN